MYDCEAGFYTGEVSMVSTSGDLYQFDICLDHKIKDDLDYSWNCASYYFIMPEVIEGSVALNSIPLMEKRAWDADRTLVLHLPRNFVDKKQPGYTG